MIAGAGAEPAPMPRSSDSLLHRVFNVASGPLLGAAGARREGVTVTLLYQGELADSSQIFIVRDADERPLGIVQLSSAESPEMVARGVARAQLAAAAVGTALARAVVLPLSQGEIEGRSYAVMPYCLAFSGKRWRWAIERVRLRPVVLDWLHGVAGQTMQPVPPLDIDVRFRRPIAQLRALDGASDRLVAACDRALSRLADGSWLPRYVLMHGDLWRGNLLLRPVPPGASAAERLAWSKRLAVIDWAGAQPRGHAFFDLVRVAESMGVGARRLRAEIDRHCRLLACEDIDAAACAMAAVGAILSEIGQFPVHRLLAMADSVLERIEEALSCSPAPAPARRPRG